MTQGCPKLTRLGRQVKWKASTYGLNAILDPRQSHPHKNLASLIDLPQTLLAAAGLPAPPEMQGRSLLPLSIHLIVNVTIRHKDETG
jgi:hypothetical protein